MATKRQWRCHTVQPQEAPASGDPRSDAAKERIVSTSDCKIENVVRTTVISMGSGVADAKGHVVFSSSKMLDKSGTLKAKHERKS